MTQPERTFLDELADLSHPADRALLLARALGEVIRAGSRDPNKRRDAVDELLKVTEKHAGLRL
ncbi:MAG: hypothetical protein J5I81_06295 [Nitrococcus mobilis]|nr:hypothetical protein [Nitrococcus mobilis]